MPRTISSMESIIITTGEVGQIFYTHKTDREMTGIATYYGRKIKTERGIFVSGFKENPKSQYLTKVILGEKNDTN